MPGTSVQQAPVKESETKRDAQKAETIEVSVGGKAVKVTQATIPTGIFPIPERIRNWAGLK